MDVQRVNQAVSGRRVAAFETDAPGAATVLFEDGSSLVLAAGLDGVRAEFRKPPASRGAEDRDGPTARQREYLDFIQRYMARYGVSPAETDIQQHFMVSAPSAHLMVRTLERRGFITREKDLWGQAIPRSIRVLRTE